MTLCQNNIMTSHVCQYVNINFAVTVANQFCMKLITTEDNTNSFADKI